MPLNDTATVQRNPLHVLPRASGDAARGSALVVRAYMPGPWLEGALRKRPADRSAVDVRKFAPRETARRRIRACEAGQ